MAGTTAAVTAVVSKLDALLQQEAEEEQQQHRNVVPRGARRAAASIRTDLVGALSFVSKVSADEDRADLCWQLAHGGIRQQVDRAVRVLDKLLWEMDMDDPTPGPGRTTTAAAQASGHRARSRALRELCHGHGYGYDVATGDSSLDASTSAAAARAPGYCARTLRELCYDTEDFLDDFLLALPVDRTRKKRPPAPAPTTRGRGPPFLFPSVRNSWAMSKADRRVHRKLSDVELVATETTKRLVADRVLNTSSSRKKALDDAAAASIVPGVEEDDPRRPLPVPVPAAAALVGVDGQRDELARMLLMGEESGDGEEAAAAAVERQVVVIVGDAGMGKTTLAHEVYRAVGGHFHCRAWVSASENRSWKSILADILGQVKEPRDGGFPFFYKDDDERLIYKSLEHKRYLIVLDDISMVDGYKLCFPWNKMGSRILITATRDDRIVRSQWPRPRVFTRFYYMSGLTGDYARLLFYRRMFGSEDRCPPELAQVADQVLRQCHGSPLAITVMSGLLANKPRTRPVWEDIFSCIDRSNSSSNRTEEICLMGYYALPNYLKTCLVYLSSMFPEDRPISRDRAVRSWIAEGFVSEEHGVTLEEAGQSYFDDLVNRSMVQPACCGYGYDYGGKPEVYTIHGLIRRRLTRENFVTMLDNGENVNESKPGGEIIRRLSVTNAEKDVGIPESMDTSHTRSLFIFGGVVPRLSFRDFVFLRALDLEGCNDLDNRHVVEIAELVHLRYLSMRDTAISELPHQICQLQHLTMLDLRGTSVQELPASVVYLQRLKHLLCDKMRLPECIQKVGALSHLSRFDIFQSTTVAMEALGNLSELTQLEIWWSPCAAELNDTERYEQFAFAIYRLKGLQSLRIHGSDSSVDFLDHLHHPLGRLQKIQLNGRCYVNRIPSWFRSVPALTYLRIDVKEVKNGDLRLLSELPSLRHLSLSSRTVPTEKLVIRRDGFPVLQEFQLCSVRPDLAFEPQAMRMLETLLLSLHVLPEEIHGFSISIDQFMCLKQIEIRIEGKRRVVDASEVFEAQNIAIRNAAGHTNCPAVRIIHANLIVKSLNCVLEEGKAKKQKLETVN